MTSSNETSLTHQAKTVRVAAVQMASGPDIERNLNDTETLLAEAAGLGCRLVLLPENFAVFGSKNLVGLAEDELHQGPILTYLHQAAQRHGLWIIAGSAPFASRRDGGAASPNKVYAGCSVWNPDGQCVARYDKVHLFNVDVADSVGRYRESDQFDSGCEPTCVDTPWGKCGLSICYDLRFPELYRRLVSLGATLLTVPSAFTYQTGQAHWEVLLRARAIENQCFVLAANQGGHHGHNRVTWGHSCIIDPWGEIVAMNRDSGSAVIWADLDLSIVDAVRAKMPALQHAKMLPG